MVRSMARRRRRATSASCSRSRSSHWAASSSPPPPIRSRPTASRGGTTHPSGERRHEHPARTRRHPARRRVHRGVVGTGVVRRRPPRCDSTDAAPDPIFTDLPDNLPAVVGELTQSVTAGAASDYDAAIALQQWFRNEFEYSLEVQSGHGSNAIEIFLDQRVGYCEQFSATFAAMARTLDIPSRVAVGFTPGVQSDDGWYSGAGQERARVARALVRRSRMGCLRADARPRGAGRRVLHGGDRRSRTSHRRALRVPAATAATAAPLPTTPSTVVPAPTTVAARRPPTIRRPRRRSTGPTPRSAGSGCRPRPTTPAADPASRGARSGSCSSLVAVAAVPSLIRRWRARSGAHARSPSSVCRQRGTARRAAAENAGVGGRRLDDRARMGAGDRVRNSRSRPDR